MMTVNHKELSNVLKRYIVDVLIMSGLFILLKELWDALEIKFDGGIQVSVSDTIIAAILVLILWKQIRKWIVIKESEVEQ